MTDQALNNDEAFKLADALLDRPLAWSKSAPALSDTPMMSFVKFRGFDRAITQYRSLVQLLRSGCWEDALILVRYLYELNVNLSAISRSPDPEQEARRFLRFGKFSEIATQRIEPYVHAAPLDWAFDRSDRSFHTARSGWARVYEMGTVLASSYRR